MKKFLLLISVLSISLLFGCQQKASKKLTIATAANMQFAMEALTQAFKEQSGIDCESIVSSSGKLTAQIQEGAPFDVFVSADLKYPAELFQNGFSTQTPTVYSYGRLVLWTLVEDLQPSMELLTDDKIKHIALANPKTAPYGNATMEIINHYNIFSQVKEKLVYGESIAQTNQFITSKAAEVGFTAKSVVLSSAMKGQGKWIEIADSLYTPIAQGVIILNNRQDQLVKARKFHDFLLSSEGKEILDKFGYLAH